MLSRYFQEELANLRDLAREFSELHPALAPYLSGPSADPDVERLLEGVAFLTGMLRQKLDDEFPEIINELMDLIWPHYLRPIPSTSIVAFSLKPGLKQVLRVPRGTGLASLPVDGTSCIFRTCRDVEVQPCRVVDAAYREHPGRPIELCITLELEGIALSDWDVTCLDFYLGGDYASASDLYCLMCSDVTQVKLHPLDSGSDTVLPASAVLPGGFGDEEALLPYPSNTFPGYRIIQEYFINPRKFLFVSLQGLDAWTGRGDGSRLEIIFQLSSGRDTLPAVTSDSIVLSAVPVINIFSSQAEPVRMDHRRFKYPVRASAANPDHYQVYSVEKVTGFVQGTAVEREYMPFDLLGSDSKDTYFYNVIKQPSVSGVGLDWYVSVVHQDIEQISGMETLSIDLLCTNGFLPEQLQLGDICRPTSTTPELVEFRNITPASPSSVPSLGRDLLWRLISHLNLNYMSLVSADNLKALLKLYIFTETRNKKQAAVNLRRVQGVEKLDCHVTDRLISGLVFRGQDITLQARRDHFASRGDMYLFGSILERFLGCYAAINSFIRFTLQESFTGEQFKWAPRTGDRPLL